MFTPQRKGWSLTPRTAEKRSLGGSAFGKGKGLATADVPPPPPQSFLGENGTDDGRASAEAEVWKSFRQAGMLDEAVLEKKDREALLERIGKLESELYDYQYNMGLLLIEKKEWISKYNEFEQRMNEAEEILKREQAANLIVISELEKREDNLKNALGVEKQCVTDLEKALREMRSEHADVKYTSDSKLAEAQALKEKIEEKSLEIEVKMRSADAQLAELSRKSSDVERKLMELATRESILTREKLSLNTERELHAEDIARQREDLRAWERSLREGQERLVESQSLLNQKEKRLNDRDNVLAKKEKELEMTRDTVEKDNSLLKEKEDYINIRLTALVAKEKDAELEMKNLQKKSEDLAAKEEMLNARERVEIQKLVDDHKIVLDSERHAFELELAERRKTLDEELKNKLIDVEKKECEINVREEKLLKREQSLEKKIEKLNDDKKELDVKAKALKRWEDAMKIEETELDKKKKQLTEDNHHLEVSREEIEAARKAMEAEKLQLLAEQEKLRVTEQERDEHLKLQSKLKQEIDECRIMKGSLQKERDELRQERENFEREWEVLDEKRTALAAEIKKVGDEKESLEKWKHNEEIRLRSEQQEANDNIQRDLDDLRMKKEAFEANVAHDKSELLEMLQRERGDMAQELDQQKHEIQIDLQKRLHELEDQYQQKEALLNEQRTAEMDHIKSLRDYAESEMQKMKVEKSRLDREKEEHINERKKLEGDQCDIQNDIDTLRNLSRSLKVQREEFIKEREYFLSQICKNCGVQFEFIFPAVRPVHEIADPENVFLPSLADGFLEDPSKLSQRSKSPVGNEPQSGASSGRMSWLRTCTKKIFSFSPGKRVDTTDKDEKSNIFELRLDKEASADIAHESVQPGATGPSEGFDKAVKGPVTSHVTGDNSIEIHRIELDNGVEEIIGVQDTSSLGGLNETETLSPLAEEGIEPQALKKKVQRGGKHTKPKAIRRTHSVQAVVEESKAFLKTSEKNGYGKTKDPFLNTETSQGDSVHTGRTPSVGQKRQFPDPSGTTASDMDADSEAHSESVSLGGRRKRRQIAASEAQAVGEKRYNFRRSTIVGKTKGAKTKNHPESTAREQSHDAQHEREETSKHNTAVASPLSTARVNDRGDVHMLQRSTTDSIVKVQESSSQKMVQLEIDELQMDNDAEIEVNAAESASALAGQDNEVYQTEEGEEWEEDDESDSEKHNASIGKKLWNFFTS